MIETVVPKLPKLKYWLKNESKYMYRTFSSLIAEKRSTRMATTMLRARMVTMIAKDTSKSSRHPRTVNDGSIPGAVKGIPYTQNV